MLKSGNITDQDAENHSFIKKFVEERELTLMLVVDVSGSGLFGSRDQSKRSARWNLPGLGRLECLFFGHRRMPALRQFQKPHHGVAVLEHFGLRPRRNQLKRIPLGVA